MQYLTKKVTSTDTVQENLPYFCAKFLKYIYKNCIGTSHFYFIQQQRRVLSYLSKSTLSTGESLPTRVAQIYADYEFRAIFDVIKSAVRKIRQKKLCLSLFSLSVSFSIAH